MASAEAMALMSRDDADEILVDIFTTLHKWAKKYTATVADETILQAALDQRAIRLWILEKLGFENPAMELALTEGPLPLFDNVASVLEVIKFLKEYGPLIRQFIEEAVKIINAFKGISPSVPAATEGGIPHPKF